MKHASAVPAVVELPPREYRKLLRAKAAERQISFKVFCTNSDESGWKYQGDAWSYGHHPLDYIEDGGVGFWSVHGETQDEAIRKLYELLSDVSAPRNIPPDHRPSQTEVRHRQCDPPFEGGPQ
jgi:hypothetical protein